MHNARIPIRQVPEARIKKLGNYIALNKIAETTIDDVIETMANQMGKEIALKLIEFNKVTIKQFNNQSWWYSEIEIIVPPNPAVPLNISHMTRRKK